LKKKFKNIWQIVVKILSLTCQTIRNSSMKYSEFFKIVKKSGWKLLRQGKGSHEIWIKDGKTVAIPNHGSKEMPTGLEKSLKKEMGL